MSATPASRVVPARDDAVLVECADLERALVLFASLRDDPVPGVVDLVPGARTVLVRYDPRTVTAAELAETVRVRETADAASTGPDRPAGRFVRIPVDYSGEDLAEVATLLGITPDEVVARHTATEYTVGFTGFAPGFAYLTGGEALEVPRRSTPRTRIPAGAVGLAGRFSGIYPRESPGGWQIIGTTAARMWDLTRDRPALLAPGDRVRFVRQGDAVGATPPAAPVPPAGPVQPIPTRSNPTRAALHVVSAGALTLLQDLGRPGLAAMGVSASGAADPVALRAANRLVGNDAATACLELVGGGLELAARGTRVLAVTGAGVELIIVRADGELTEVPFGRPFVVEDGESLRVGVPTTALRSYLAVRGGFDLAPVLGSLSTDVLSGIGPDPIVAGAVLPVRTPATGLAAVDTDWVPPAEQTVELNVVLGPRDDWFTSDAVAALAAQTWTVSSQSNRVGLRLDGEPLTRSTVAELPSEGTLAGAIQVPSDGRPVLFLADHPVTGGYPVIAAVASYHLHLAGQLPPGAAVRFRPISPNSRHRVAVEDRN